MSAENMGTVDLILNKKTESYGFEKNDFVAPSEITVTITLGEYRSLITKAATADEAIRKAEADKFSRDADNKRLKEMVEALRAELYDLQKRAEKEGAE
jgi:hypothetical protein